VETEQEKILTAAQKKYLFAIYIHGSEGNSVKLTSVAKTLGVSKASVVKMTQRLTDDGYIIKEPYREIRLTPSGAKAANGLFTSYLIMKNFLTEKVGISPENSDSDSVTIVSQISDEGLEKLVRYGLDKADLQLAETET
jgi:DtxR family Mn-dependent transcriptional regulator